MATSWPPEEFVCPVCLEVLRDPATIPCGHTYCLACIQKHWDQGEAKGLFYCPQCRQEFKPRPALARSTLLMEAMEKLRVRGQDESPLPEQLSISVGGAGAVDDAPTQGSLYPQLPVTSVNLCSLHQQVLELYCCEDGERVCDECSLLGHKGHRVVRPEEERTERQQELAQMQESLKKIIKEKEGEIQALPHSSQAYQVSVREVQRERKEVFAALLKSLEIMGSEVEDLLGAHGVSALSRVEVFGHGLQQEIGRLRQREEELSGLAGTEDPIHFLNNFLAMDAAHPTGNGEGPKPFASAVLPGVRAALGEFRVGLQDFCNAHLTAMFRMVNDAASAPMPNNQESEPGPANQGTPSVTNGDSKRMPVPPVTQRPAVAPVPVMAPRPAVAPVPVVAPRPAVAPAPAAVPVPSVTPQHPPTRNPFPNPVSQPSASCLANPEPKTRPEMLKFRFEPTLDHNTAHRHIRLSDGDRKATLRAENQNYPEHPDRFLYWRQVLCLEPLAGSPYYWEVEWTGQKVSIGVAYRDMGRAAPDDSARLGYNERSWNLYWSGTAFSLWHAGKETPLAGPKARHIGVYLDQQAGSLAFYRISHGQAHLIHSLHTDFSGPLLPGFRFWSGVGSTITISQLE